jgi:hypothetical protein
VQLNWSTAPETDNYSFTVERSAEQKIWQVIETIPGAGNSILMNTYAFTDRQPIQTISYYRLKQTNLDGNTNYGKIIQVRNCGDNGSDKITTYPNPSASGKFELLFTGDKSQVISIGIFNALGEKIYQSNSFQSVFDLSDRATGVYFVQVHLFSTNLTQKIVVKK